MRPGLDGSGFVRGVARITLACLVPVILLAGVVLIDEIHKRIYTTPNRPD